MRDVKGGNGPESGACWICGRPKILRPYTGELNELRQVLLCPSCDAIPPATWKQR